GGSSRRGLSPDGDGAVERGMAYSRQHWNAAAFDCKLDQANAIVGGKVQKLARRSQQRDPVDTGACEKVDQLECSADIRLGTSLPMRRHGCHIDARNWSIGVHS